LSGGRLALNFVCLSEGLLQHVPQLLSLSLEQTVWVVGPEFRGIQPANASIAKHSKASFTVGTRAILEILILRHISSPRLNYHLCRVQGERQIRKLSIYGT